MRLVNIFEVVFSRQSYFTIYVVLFIPFPVGFPIFLVFPREEFDYSESSPPPLRLCQLEVAVSESICKLMVLDSSLKHTGFGNWLTYLIFGIVVKMYPIGIVTLNCSTRSKRTIFFLLNHLNEESISNALARHQLSDTSSNYPPVFLYLVQCQALPCWQQNKENAWYPCKPIDSIPNLYAAKSP